MWNQHFESQTHYIPQRTHPTRKQTYRFLSTSPETRVPTVDRTRSIRKDVDPFPPIWFRTLHGSLPTILDPYVRLFPSLVVSSTDEGVNRDQRVTIESTSQVVRIVGITPDHGLLRTIAVTLDREGNEVRGKEGKEFVDLQPGGHGFDMLHGLLVSRST